VAARGRAYLVERAREEKRANADAAIQALVDDDVRRASILDEVAMDAVLV
jgi:hypothetical protein